METLTLLILVVVFVLLLTSVFVGRRFFSRSAKSSRFPQRHGDIRPGTPSTSASLPPPAKARVIETTTIATLELKLINRFAGNRGAMDRTTQLYRSKFPRLTEIELLEKMLYDLERGH